MKLFGHLSAFPFEILPRLVECPEGFISAATVLVLLGYVFAHRPESAWPRRVRRLATQGA